MVVLNIVVLSVSILLPYTCLPIYKFCKDLPEDLIAKPKYSLVLLFTICNQSLGIIVQIYGLSSLFENYQMIMYVIGIFLSKSIKLIAQSLAGIGVTFLSNRSQKVSIL